MADVHYSGIRIAYVLKRYPRYSETFIVNEILAHEAVGLDLRIFSLRPPTDTHFQDILARVRAPLTYLPYASIKTLDFWKAIETTGRILPGLWPTLETAQDECYRDVYQALMLAQAVNEQGIQHLHAHFATSATTVARLAARFAGISYTFTAHAKDIFHQDVNTDDLRCKLTEAASVVTVSDYNQNYLLNKYGTAAATTVTRIYNGLDLTRFPYTSPLKRDQQILAVGRLVEKKGFIDLVEACAILNNQGQGIHCQIIGSGPLQDELETRIRQLGVEDKVELLGPRPQQDIIQHVRDATVLAAPCVVGSDGNQDGLPTVLLEAMALGTPCISTDVTGIPEVIQNNETGLMVPQQHPQALADAIKKLLQDATLRVQLSKAARHLIETEFDIHRNTKQMRKCFVAALHDNQPSHAAIREAS